jgi:hypothetical protein
MDSQNASAISSAPHANAASASVTGVPPGLFWANTLVAGLAIAFGCWALFQATLAERETRMLQYYVLEVDGKLMKSGIIDKGYEAWKREREK